MGTNYYFMPQTEIDRVAAECSGDVEPIHWHIGKSSAGWCFSLHVGDYDETRKIGSLADLIRLLDEVPGEIRDEYDEVVGRDDLLARITNRGGSRSFDGFDFARNHAVPGPNGLVRHAIGLFCVGHGDGTWDLIPGEFS